jgi:hypothetical protein
VDSGPCVWLKLVDPKPNLEWATQREKATDFGQACEGESGKGRQATAFSQGLADQPKLWAYNCCEMPLGLSTFPQLQLQRPGGRMNIFSVRPGQRHTEYDGHRSHKLMIQVVAIANFAIRMVRVRPVLVRRANDRPLNPSNFNNGAA